MSTSGRGRVNRPLSRRCVNCSLRLAPNLRKRQIEELDEPMLTFLRSWVKPTLISSDDILCVECFVLLQNRTSLTTTLPLVSPALGHLSICFACGISIASRRTHRVSQDCPQRNVLLKWTPAHHVLHLERVCHACWEAASRKIQSQAVRGVNRHTVESVPVTDNMDDKIADAVIPVPHPLPLPVPPPQEQQLHRTFSKINSLKYKRVSASSRHCLFHGCTNTERLLVPGTIKEVLLYHHKVYIPCTARICRYHLHSNRWDELEAPYSDFTGFQVDDIFTKLEKLLRDS